MFPVYTGGDNLPSCMHACVSPTGSNHSKKAISLVMAHTPSKRTFQLALNGGHIGLKLKTVVGSTVVGHNRGYVVRHKGFVNP